MGRKGGTIIGMTVGCLAWSSDVNIVIIPLVRAEAACAKVACAIALLTCCVVGTSYWNVSCTSGQCTCLVQAAIVHVRAKVARHLLGL